MDISPIEGIPELIISSQGIFKYILIQAFLNNEFIGYFVRGDTKYEYHADNFKAFKQQLSKYGFKNLSKKGAEIVGERGNRSVTFKCPGGGRIEHEYKGKKCSIYGYSKTYGHVDHKIAMGIVMKSLGYKQQEVRLGEKQY